MLVEGILLKTLLACTALLTFSIRDRFGELDVNPSVGKVRGQRRSWSSRRIHLTTGTLSGQALSTQLAP